MKSLRVFTFFACALLLANSSSAQGGKGKNDAEMPYKALYSSDFRMGNPAYVKKILDLWKDWDDNLLDRHDYMADTVVMMLPDGIVLKGKESAMSSSKAYRNTLGNVKSQLHAWIPLYSNDRKEDAVLVWGTEERTNADGKVENVDLHEVWWFNKDGKISVMRQWAAHFGAL